jgi:hypothetical protein
MQLKGTKTSANIIRLLKEKSAAVKFSKLCLFQPNSKQASTRVKKGNIFRNKKMRAFRSGLVWCEELMRNKSTS